MRPIHILSADHSHVCDDYWLKDGNEKTQVFFSPSHPYNLTSEDVEKLSACVISGYCVVVDIPDNPDGHRKMIPNGVTRVKEVVEEALKNYRIYSEVLKQASTEEEVKYAKYHSWLDDKEG